MTRANSDPRELPWSVLWIATSSGAPRLSGCEKKSAGGFYLTTTHAEEEMDYDGLTIYDVESVILTGGIIERQRDRKT